MEPTIEAPSYAAAPLPRLQIIHLMVWTAATAIAFLPYQFRSQATEALASNTSARVEMPAVAASAIYGVAQGAFLMSAASILYWRRKGLDSRLEPGHWLAFWGACEWLVWMLVWGALLLAGGRLERMALLSPPQLLVNVVFFFIFVRLSLRWAEPRRWQLTYAIVAIMPVLGWLLAIALSFAAFRTRSIAAFMIAPLVASGIVLLALAAASMGDVRRRHERHWSHWLGVGAQLFILAVAVAMYAYYIAFPPGPGA